MRPLRHLWRSPRQSVAELRAALHFPPAEAGQRVFAPLSDLTAFDGLKNLSGVVSLYPKRRLDYFATETQRLGGAQWAQTLKTRKWSPVPDPLPYARLVAETRVSDDPRRDLGTIDLAATALTDRPIPLRPGPAGRAALLGRSSGRLSLQTECDDARLLVVAESWHPGWHAAVDGVPADVPAVYGDFLGCVVPSGRHSVEFHFLPRSLWQGGALGACGLVALLAVAVAPARRRRGVPLTPQL